MVKSNPQLPRQAHHKPTCPWRNLGRRRRRICLSGNFSIKLPWHGKNTEKTWCRFWLCRALLTLPFSWTYNLQFLSLMALHWSLEWQQPVIRQFNPNWDLKNVIVAKYYHTGTRRHEEWIYFRQDVNRPRAHAREVGFLRRTKGKLGPVYLLWYLFLHVSSTDISIFHIFSCSHGTCLAGVTEHSTPAARGISASTEMWSPFTPPDGHAQTHRRSTNAGTTSFTRATKLGWIRSSSMLYPKNAQSWHRSNRRI